MTGKPSPLRGCARVFRMKHSRSAQTCGNWISLLDEEARAVELCAADKDTDARRRLAHARALITQGEQQHRW